MSSFGFFLLVLTVSPWAGKITINSSPSAEQPPLNSIVTGSIIVRGPGRNVIGRAWRYILSDEIFIVLSLRLPPRRCIMSLPLDFKETPDSSSTICQLSNMELWWAWLSFFPCHAQTESAYCLGNIFFSKAPHSHWPTALNWKKNSLLYIISALVCLGG